MRKSAGYKPINTADAWDAWGAYLQQITDIPTSCGAVPPSILAAGKAAMVAQTSFLVFFQNEIDTSIVERLKSSRNRSSSREKVDVISFLDKRELRYSLHQFCTDFPPPYVPNSLI